MLQVVSGNKRILLRFKDVCEKYLTLNKLNVVTVDMLPTTKKVKVATIYVMPDDTVDFEKGQYNGVYGLL